MVCVSWRGKREIMTVEEADELRTALGRATSVQNSTVTQIIWTVCDHFHLPVAQVMSDQRDAPVALARQVAMHFIRQLTQLSSVQIGELFPKENGKARDRGTVEHACRRVRTRCAKDGTLAADCAEIEQALVNKP